VNVAVRLSTLDCARATPHVVVAWCEDLDRGGADANLDVLTDQLVGDRVIVTVTLDAYVIVGPTIA
jgi:hypothetical protein